MSFKLPKVVRLTRASEFWRVREQGKPHFGRHLILNVLRAESGSGEIVRVGFVTSRKVGNAVTRNRVRRRLREIVRRQLPLLKEGVQVVTVARRAAADASSAELCSEWLRLANRASILSR